MNISYFLEQYFQANHLPISCFEGNNLLAKGTRNIQDFNLPMLLINSLPKTLPSIWYTYTPEYMYLGGISIEENDQLLLVGPILLADCSPKQAKKILTRIGRSPKDYSTLIQSFKEYTTCNVASLQAHLQLLYFLFNHSEAPSVDYLEFHWKHLFPVDNTPAIEIENDSANSLENILLSCVRYGKVEQINQVINEHVLYADTFYGISSNLSLNQMRSYILGANMLASRTAIECGVDYSLGDSITNHYIEEILKATTTTDLSLTFANLITTYTKEVAKLQTLPGTSPLVHRINSCIQARLYEKITPTSIAKHLKMNTSYLCTQFKLDTGKTISSYIQECKIQEAKRLLECGNVSNIYISELLCFSSQSYFCSIFKKYTGKTPQEYQQSYFNFYLT